MGRLFRGGQHGHFNIGLAASLSCPHGPKRDLSAALALILAVVRHSGPAPAAAGYPLTIGFVSVQSVAAALAQAGVSIPCVTALLDKIPLAARLRLGAAGLGGLLLGLLLSGRPEEA